MVGRGSVDKWLWRNWRVCTKCQLIMVMQLSRKEVVHHAMALEDSWMLLGGTSSINGSSALSIWWHFSTSPLTISVWRLTWLLTLHSTFSSTSLKTPRCATSGSINFQRVSSHGRVLPVLCYYLLIIHYATQMSSGSALFLLANKEKWNLHLRIDQVMLFSIIITIGWPAGGPAPVPVPHTWPLSSLLPTEYGHDG